MPLELVTIPCLEDNYAFLVHNSGTGDTLLVDVPDAPPIKAALDAQGWVLTDVLLTHHHWDHVDGLAPLLSMIDAKPRVIGAKADAHRLPALDAELVEGDTVKICGEDTVIYDVSGHTVGHIAVYFPTSAMVFTADSLMALGCGRLFEGTPAVMWDSLQKLRALPDDTRVCSGHEYTQTNARFALTIEPDNLDLISRIEEINQTRAAGLPTVPSNLGYEKRTNPFLRADEPALKSAINMVNADAVDIFAEIRKRRDVF
jgi:hydroxyacylglutathione hydrolase